MPTCPHCHQSVDGRAIACPHCRTELKAHGHPGIPLYRATTDASLCDSCTYHADDTCNFPQRPHAQDCTLYRNLRPATPPSARTTSSPLHPFSLQPSSLRQWLQRHTTPVVLGLIVAISLMLALRGR